MTALGFVVLARRPNPTRRSSNDSQYIYEPVSAVFNGPKALEQAQNVLESYRKKIPQAYDTNTQQFEPVEYVIGEIGEWNGR